MFHFFPLTLRIDINCLRERAREKAQRSYMSLYKRFWKCKMVDILENHINVKSSTITSVTFKESSCSLGTKFKWNQGTLTNATNLPLRKSMSSSFRINSPCSVPQPYHASWPHFRDTKHPWPPTPRMKTYMCLDVFERRAVRGPQKTPCGTQRGYNDPGRETWNNLYTFCYRWITCLNLNVRAPYRDWVDTISENNWYTSWLCIT